MYECMNERNNDLINDELITLLGWGMDANLKLNATFEFISGSDQYADLNIGNTFQY